MGKLVRIIFGVALVAAAGYFLLGREKSLSFKSIDNFLTDKNLSSFTGSTGESLKSKAEEIFYSVSSGVQDKAGELASAAAEKAKSYAFDVFKQGVEEGVESVGQKMGINVNNSDDSASASPESAYIAYSIKKDTAAYFTIRNSENDLLKYKVDWLDGKNDSGQLTKKDESIVLSHKWSASGEYLITFEILDSKGTKNHKVLIAVLD